MGQRWYRAIELKIIPLPEFRVRRNFLKRRRQKQQGRSDQESFHFVVFKINYNANKNPELNSKN